MQIGLASAAIKTATGDKFSVHRYFLHLHFPLRFFEKIENFPPRCNDVLKIQKNRRKIIPIFLILRRPLERV
jgi:hypothetical protein